MAVQAVHVQSAHQNARSPVGAVRRLRRYERLQVAESFDVDYRSKTFSCSVCGGPAWLCVVEPTTERGMEDYRLDERDRPVQHPATVDRPGQIKRRRIDFSGRGEQPGRKSDSRR
jgi:hypothetical protein